MLEGTVHDIFWDYSSERDISGLPYWKKEELARYCLGKIRSNKIAWKGHKIIRAIRRPALKFLFPALEHEGSDEVLEDIIEVANSGEAEKTIAAKYAVGTLHNKLSRPSGKKVIMETGKYSSRFLVYALNDDTIIEDVEEMLLALHGDERYKDVVKEELERALNPEYHYKPLVIERAEQILARI